MANRYDAVLGKLRKADITQTQINSLGGKTEILTSGTSVAVTGTTYCFDGNNIVLNLGGTPVLNDRIRIRHLSGTGSLVGGKIEGIVHNVFLDIPKVAFDLVYTNSTYGWVITETNQ